LRLVQYEYCKKKHLGVWQGDRVLQVKEFADSQEQDLPDNLEKLIALNRGEDLEKLVSDARSTEIERYSLLASDVALSPPLTTPPKIICLGLNYKDHIAEQKAVVPNEPIIFIKPRTAIIAPLQSIVKPSFVKQLDYEAELAIVVGREAKNVSASEASSYVFGYTIINDVSARDIQFKDGQWTRGKGFDTFAPLGPCVVTTSQLLDVSDLYIRTWVNGELRQNSTTSNMIFDIPEIIHRLSRVMTLEPCDVIATGTPGGVGFAIKPFPVFLNSGDVVRIEIEGIGVLENNIADESS
jgi:acylpyruvate hydrolase